MPLSGKTAVLAAEGTATTWAAHRNATTSTISRQCTAARTNLRRLNPFVPHIRDLTAREGAKRLLAPLAGRFPRLAKFWVDAGYAGQFAARVGEELGWEVEVVRRARRWVRCAVDEAPPPAPAGFQTLPRRWVVERTFAWLGLPRRLSKDYEALPATEEAWTYLAMIKLMTTLLAR